MRNVQQDTTSLRRTLCQWIYRQKSAEKVMVKTDRLVFGCWQDSTGVSSYMISTWSPEQCARTRVSIETLWKDQSLSARFVQNYKKNKKLPENQNTFRLWLKTTESFFRCSILILWHQISLKPYYDHAKNYNCAILGTCLNCVVKSSYSNNRVTVDA